MQTTTAFKLAPATITRGADPWWAARYVWVISYLMNYKIKVFIKKEGSELVIRIKKSKLAVYIVDYTVCNCGFLYSNTRCINSEDTSWYISYYRTNFHNEVIASFVLPINTPFYDYTPQLIQLSGNTKALVHILNSAIKEYCERNNIHIN